MLIAAIFVPVLLFMFVTICLLNEPVSLIVVIFFSGALGGVTNNYLRLKHFPSDMGELERTKANQLAIYQVWISPMIAGVFGIVLYALFASGIVSGSLFPEFKDIHLAYKDFLDLVNIPTPKARLDGAKAIVWGFIAGFSERLVPNIIDRLSQEAVKKQ